MKRLHRMPGASLERGQANKNTQLEPSTTKGFEGCSIRDSSQAEQITNEMGSVARFPKLDECAHFHYEHVELGHLEVSMAESGEPDNFTVRVTSGDACWTLQRSLDELLMLDRQLHRCIFDREFSMLPDLAEERVEPNTETLERLHTYLHRFTELSHEGLNCGPVLNWLQLDNRGRRILVPEADSCPINTPAVAAAYAVRPYRAQAQDELSFQVGDMISVIDMPPAGESSWWRGKLGFAVGFFPAECVAVFGDKLPRRLAIATSAQQRDQQPHERLQSGRLQPVKPVLRKHGKLIAFFRSFILNRPSRRRLKQSGILRERVFGCDLGEHLLNSGREVPCVLSCCAEFIERHGLVDGIYRLSGVASNIQRLRHAFDEDRPPALQADGYIRQDIHSVASLLKMYFRELPNPLCTYQLYAAFVGAVRPAGESERLRRMREAVRELPPPHYRTLEYLIRHLERVAARGDETGMTARNLAIVWAPNLLRSKELELAGVAALQGVGIQAVVTEFLIRYAELVFAAAGQRPKSLAVAAGSKRLLSLEEARNRSVPAESTLLEVGSGTAGLPTHYHTIIELPSNCQQRRRNSSKRSPSLNWRALFGGKQNTKVPTPPEPRLRPVKSADSLEGLPEDSLGPLPVGAISSRSCGHSRSVSHDSYFEQLGEQLSELPSIENTLPGLPGAAGSRRKRSRLEERLQCEAELRFIDSQSPDQVMLSADVHEMESPSPLPTPEYLPLLSEGSTPLSPTKTTAPLELLDHDMRPCDRLLGGMLGAHYHGLDSIQISSTRLHSEDKKYKTVNRSVQNQSNNTHNVDLPSSQCIIDLDSHMPYEQNYEYSLNSNFISINPRERIINFTLGQGPSFIRNPEKWFLTDMSPDAISSSNREDNKQLHQITNLKTIQMLAVEESSSGSSTPKSCQESMYYSELHGSYKFDDRQQLMNSNFNQSHEDNGINAVQNRDCNSINQTDVLNLVSIKKNILLPKLTLLVKESNDEPSVSQVTSNIKNLTNYQNNQIQIQTSNWNPLLDSSSRSDSNQNKNDCTINIADHNHQFFMERKCEDLQPIQLVFEHQEKIVKNNNSNELQENKKNCNETITQITNNSNICNTHNEYHSKSVDQESINSSTTQITRIRDDIDVVIPSENAAVEPQEMAHVPEMISENIILDSSSSIPSANNSKLIQNSIIYKDTATILQELALQRLSGGNRVDSITVRKRYDSDFIRDRRSFDSEIGREIVREHKMKQELENARGKMDESLIGSHNQTVTVPHLPPCLRARQARANRAALSRSLDEAKFNKMTSNNLDDSGQQLQSKQDTLQQHSSTPNVDNKTNSQPGNIDKTIQSLNKNLGLDLDDPRCRERIEKYKEERRTFLRDKYRSESFRAIDSPPTTSDAVSSKENGEQTLPSRLKHRVSRPSLL